ncbi:MAG: hypothetical protein ACI808_001969, partial [Paraglaciecola sp.]
MSIPNKYSEDNDLTQSLGTVQTEYKPISDLQGISRLAIEAVVNVCETVESVHKAINNIAGLPSSQKKQQAGGIASFVYKNIRNITELVGTTIDAPLAAISDVLLKDKSLPANETLRSALNGVLGDHLHKRA